MIASLADLHFLRPLWLALLPLAAAVWWVWRRRVDPLRGWRGQIAPELLSALVVGERSGRSAHGVLLLVAWTLGIVAVAGPTWRREPSPFADDATPLVVVLKADASMAAPDPAPSRLARAQLAIADLAAARPNQPLGLIVYAGSAHLVLPPTRDAGVVAQMAAEIAPEIMPTPGDRLDLALRAATELLAGDAARASVVVVADSVAAEPATLRELADGLEPDVQFLAVGAPGSDGDRSLRDAAQALGAPVVALAADGQDVASIVARAARTPVALADGEDARWQEAGYWILPLLALGALSSFRRERRELPEEAA